MQKSGNDLIEKKNKKDNSQTNCLFYKLSNSKDDKLLSQCLVDAFKR